MPIQPIFCALPVAIANSFAFRRCPSIAGDRCNAAKDAVLVGAAAVTLCLQANA
jgi:hypothetical protein